VALFCGLAVAQTYVRPSKGRAYDIMDNIITPAGVDGGTILPEMSGSSNFYYLSKKFDWTAFSGLRLSLVGKGATANIYGQTCSNVTQSWDVYGVDNFIQVRLGNATVAPTALYPLSTKTIYVSVLTAPTMADVFRTGNFNNSTHYVTSDPYEVVNQGIPTLYSPIGCAIKLMVTPLPFSESKYVRMESSAKEPVIVQEIPGGEVNACTPKLQTTHSIIPGLTTELVNFPARDQNGYTQLGYREVCSSWYNFYGPIFCTSGYAGDAGIPGGAVAPSAETGIGQQFFPGDCARFDRLEQVRCISAVNATLNVTECEQYFGNGRTYD